MLENQMRFCLCESLRFFLSWDGFYGLFLVQKAMFSGIKPFMPSVECVGRAHTVNFCSSACKNDGLLRTLM